MDVRQIGACASIGLDLMLKGKMSEVIGYLAGAAKDLEPYAQSEEGLSKILNVFAAFGVPVDLKHPGQR